jgi:hypothetical protein
MNRPHLQEIKQFEHMKHQLLTLHNHCCKNLKSYEVNIWWW